MALLDHYGGAFEPDFGLERLSRPALARLGREFMLFAHLHDRGLMPLVGSRFGRTAMTAVACDEWIGASPVYSRRNREQLGIPGDGVSAILKALQLDVGFPHQYMDVRYELVDDKLGYFSLDFCGAYQDVFRHSGGKEAAIVQLCHHMEDTTFDATVMAVNPRARCRAEHRPPLRIGDSGPTCRWRVFMDAEAGAVSEHALTRRVRASRAARFVFPTLAGPHEGLEDYAGPFESALRLERFAQPVLARQCKEFALDTHLLMRAAFASIRERWGEEAAGELVREHWRAVAPVHLPRVRAALGIMGDDAASILKTLQVDPAFPPDYVRRRFELLDERRGRFWIEECAAFAPGEPDAWLALLEDEKDATLDATVAAVNPQARAHRIDARAWEIRIDPDAEPYRESPLANAVRASNAAPFSFRASDG